MAKYSILLPVRNGGIYIQECVASILSQTYKDFNFIILDNCSSDGTVEWIQSIKDARIKLITSNKSLTIEESWERIRHTDKNEFITLIGHDDILYPDFLMVIDGLVKEHPEASLYHTHFNFIDAEGSIIRACKPMDTSLNGYEFLKAILTGSIDLMGTGYVMRSKDYDALEGISVKYPNLLFADFELWLRLAFKKYEIIAPQDCFAFRVHKSTTGTSQDKKLHRGLEIFIDYLLYLKQQDVKAKKLITDFSTTFLLFYCKGFAHRLLRTPLYQREGLTVENFIMFTIKLAVKLEIENQYKPKKKLFIRVAKIIDSNMVSRNLFLSFKKIYSKPVSK
jgi:glycosyltransferase involved in cell wall biosynthesis